MGYTLTDKGASIVRKDNARLGMGADACRVNTKTRNWSLKERLEFYSMPITECGCIFWIASTNAKGYGVIRADKKGMSLAHRVAWQELRGPIPNGMLVLHHCDIPCCINVEHLYIGNHADNAADASKRGRLVPFPGEKNKRAKLTWDQVHQIRAMDGYHTDIAKIFCVSPAAIDKIKSGRTWK